MKQQPNVSLTAGKVRPPGTLKRHGRPSYPQAPGPEYIPENHVTRKPRPHIAEAAISTRIAPMVLAKFGAVELVQLFISVGILPDLSGRCPSCQCGKLTLVECKVQISVFIAMPCLVRFSIRFKFRDFLFGFFVSRFPS